MRRCVILAAWLAACMVAGPARAQETPPAPTPAEAPKITKVQRQRPWTGLALGVGWEKVFTTAGHVSNPLPFRVLARTPTKSGWAVSPMFGWFRSDVDAVALNRPTTPMGQLTVRPILVGVRRTWAGRPLSYDVALAAGPSFNSFKVADEIKPDLALGSGAITADANISFAWRVQGSVWHDFNEKLAIRGSLAYAWVHPEITFRSGASGRRVTENANAVMIGAGLVYRIF
ncbi:hypothetical protein [Luteitalea sp.]|uniref:hypothetical protein n=1 Tax=Luteitalea sp. TaxID=2004800 RepID=UPI0037C9757F